MTTASLPHGEDKLKFSEMLTKATLDRFFRNLRGLLAALDVLRKHDDDNNSALRGIRPGLAAFVALHSAKAERTLVRAPGRCIRTEVRV
jgi:hypothetical protein